MVDKFKVVKPLNLPLEEECSRIRDVLRENHVYYTTEAADILQRKLLDPTSRCRTIVGSGFHCVVVLDACVGITVNGVFELQRFLLHIRDELVQAFGLEVPVEMYHPEQIAQVLKDEPRSLFCFLNVHVVPERDMDRLRGFTQEGHRALFCGRYSSLGGFPKTGQLGRLNWEDECSPLPMVLVNVQTEQPNAWGSVGPKLFQRCYIFLKKLARSQMPGSCDPAVEDEATAHEALVEFYRRVERGGLDQPESCGDLLALLSEIASRRIPIQLTPGHPTNQGGTNSLRKEAEPNWSNLTKIPDDAPNPEEQAVLSDVYSFFLSILPEGLRQVAEMRLAGTTDSEIARQLGIAMRTVARKVRLIRYDWERQGRD